MIEFFAGEAGLILYAVHMQSTTCYRPTNLACAFQKAISRATKEGIWKLPIKNVASFAFDAREGGQFMHSFIAKPTSEKSFWRLVLAGRKAST
jgi:hypothetical protein